MYISLKNEFRARFNRKSIPFYLLGRTESKAWRQWPDSPTQSFLRTPKYDKINYHYCHYCSNRLFNLYIWQVSEVRTPNLDGKLPKNASRHFLSNFQVLNLAGIHDDEHFDKIVVHIVSCCLDYVTIATANRLLVCTDNSTSFGQQNKSKILLTPISTLVSWFANFPVVMRPGLMLNRSQIRSERVGWEEPENTFRFSISALSYAGMIFKAINNTEVVKPKKCISYWREQWTILANKAFSLTFGIFFKG